MNSTKLIVALSFVEIILLEGCYESKLRRATIPFYIKNIYIPNPKKR